MGRQQANVISEKLDLVQPSQLIVSTEEKITLRYARSPKSESLHTTFSKATGRCALWKGKSKLRKSKTRKEEREGFVVG